MVDGTGQRTKLARKQADLAKELVEWWEDLWQRGMTSRVLLVAVPPGWGRTTVLDRLVESAGADDAPITLIVQVSGRELPDGAGVQAAVLRDCLAGEATRHRVAELLGLDRFGGITQIGLGVGGLFVSGLAGAVGFLVAGVAVGAAGKAWDDSPAGQDGALARAARAVAATSVELPVVVVIDDADWLDEELALTMVENLVARHDGHVLVVAVVDPQSSLQKALLSRARQGITEGRVQLADADPDMGFKPRTGLARELCPHLPDAVVRRIGRSTTTFADIFAVASARRLAELTADEDQAHFVAATDAVLAAQLPGPTPSAEAVVIAWAGGCLHAQQAARALGILRIPQTADDADVLRHGNLERVSNPASTRFTGKAEALAIRDRQAMAAVLLEEGLRIASDPSLQLVERLAAAQAAHHVRDYLVDRGSLPRVQRLLAAALEALGEPDAALNVIEQALDKQTWPSGASTDDRDWLTTAALRLASRTPQVAQSQLVTDLIGEALTAGAILGLEARIWAAVELLATKSQREAALNLIDQLTAALDAHTVTLGPTGDQWRLLLAFHAGRAGHPAVTSHLLTPLLNSGDDAREQAAHAVLYASAGRYADTRLQNILLEAELTALPPNADDDRLRIHHALSLNYHELGEYFQALTHAQHELLLRIRIQSPDHPDTLETRHNIAHLTGVSGDPAGALHLFRELLRDRERVLGPDHSKTLNTRNSIAALTGECGDSEAALRLCRDLLADRERILGPEHPDTLNTRNNIAFWAGKSGDPAGALRMFLELLPDLERVLGPDDPGTLTTRDNIAAFTDRCGDAAGGLRLCQELLHDRERILGPDHPDTLTTRAGFATLTSRCGDDAAALRLYSELLPIQERVLGPHHPDTLSSRNNIASLVGRSGDPATALRILQELLPDQESVLGPRHPDTLTTRNNIAYYTKMVAKD